MIRFFKKPIVRRLLLLIIALAIAGYSTWQLQAYLSQTRPQEQVLAAKHDIPGFKVITSSDLGYVTKPEGSKTEGALHNPKEIIGKVTKMTIFRGEEIFPQKLAKSPLILREYERAIGIPVDVIRAVGMSLEPGNHVDAYWMQVAEETKLPSQQQAAEETVKEAEMIAEDAVILDMLGGNNESLFNPISQLAKDKSEQRQQVKSSSGNAPNVAILKIKNSETKGTVTAVEKGRIYLVKRRQ